MRRTWYLAALLFVSVCAYAQGVYRWVDEQGHVHYADVPPDKAKAVEIGCPPGPTPEQQAEGRQRTERESKAAGEIARRREAESLASLPQNARSEYLRTLATGVFCVPGKEGRPAFQFAIDVETRADLPAGVALVGWFENPKDPAKPLPAIARAAGKGRISFLSPEFDTVQCRTYEAVFQLYRDRDRREVMGTHRQLMQSRIDSAVWQAQGLDAPRRLAERGHLCPF